MNEWDHEKQTYQERWYEDFQNVTRLGRWLVADGAEAKELQAYYEKPWQWGQEWKDMLISETRPVS